jgi:hypothetical protein
MPGLLPRHFGAAASLAIELLVAVHGNRYLQQLSAEFDGTSVRDPLGRRLYPNQPLDTHAKPMRTPRHLAIGFHDLMAAADIEVVKPGARLVSDGMRALDRRG